MGRFLSGNVSDSFRRVQYLFRLYSLPHRAAGWKSRPRMRGQFLPRADLGWHTLQNPTLTPHSCCQSKIPPKLENHTAFVCLCSRLIFLCLQRILPQIVVRVELGGSFCGDYFASNGFSRQCPMPTSTKYKAPATWYRNAQKASLTDFTQGWCFLFHWEHYESCFLFPLSPVGEGWRKVLYAIFSPILITSGFDISVNPCIERAFYDHNFP